jgi:hypothetical protein
MNVSKRSIAKKKRERLTSAFLPPCFAGWTGATVIFLGYIHIIRGNKEHQHVVERVRERERETMPRNETKMRRKKNNWGNNLRWLQGLRVIVDLRRMREYNA